MSIICPNFKNKEVKQQFDEIAAATSEQAAYHIWSQNNGNAIDRAPNGAPSKLFTDLLEHFNGDRVLAIQAKAKVFSESFKTWFGDWNTKSKTVSTDAAKRLVAYLEEIPKESRYKTLAQLLIDSESLPFSLRYFDINNNRDDIVGTSGQWNSFANLIEVLGNNVNDDSITKTLLHELIHYNTEYLLETYRKNPDNLTETQRKNIESIHKAINYAKKYILDNYDESKFRSIKEKQGVTSRIFYAFDNHQEIEIDEVISEAFTNPAFQEVLNEIPYEGTKQSIFDRIIEAIVNIFGLKVKDNSVLKEIITHSSELTEIESRIKSTNVSKVVDENGEPKILYHTVLPSYDASFDIFNTTDEKGNPTMIYFTDDLDMSKSYARNHRAFKTLEYVKKRLSEIPAEIIKRNEYVTSNLNKLTSDETYIKELGYTGFEDQSLLDLIDYYKKSQVDYTESRAKEKAELEAIIENPKSIEYTKLGFLNFKNPLIIDGRGNWWNELSLNPDDDIVEMAKHNNLVNETIEDRIREEAEKKLKGNPSLEVLPYDELLGDDEIEKIRNEVTEEVLKELGDLYKFESTRTIEEYARNIEQYDGVIFENIRDYGAGGIKFGNDFMANTVYAAKNPNQVKSATDNAGTFSQTDNSILASIAEDTEGNNTSDATLKNRLLNGQQESKVSDVLDRIEETNPGMSKLVGIIRSAMDDAIRDMPIVLVDRSNPDFMPGAAAYYDSSYKYIVLFNDVTFRGKNGTADATILHEIIHAFTYSTLRLNPTKRAEAEKLFEAIKAELVNKYGKTADELAKEYPLYFYGLTNIDEFFSEIFMNPRFSKELAKLGPTGLVNVDKSNNILLKLLDWILSIFNINRSNNAYVEGMNMLYDVMITYSKEPEGLGNIPIPPMFMPSIAASARTNDATKIKDILKQKSKHIVFDPVPHTYTNANNGKVYRAVSDVKDVAGYGADTSTMSDEDLEYGSIAASIGTTIHGYINTVLTGAKEEVNPMGYKLTKEAKRFIKDEVLPRVIGDSEVIGSEALLANDDAEIAGTMDLLIKDRNTGKIRLLDMKTKARNYKGKVKYGFDYYFSSKHETKEGGKSDRARHDYQLTLYQRMLEEYGIQVDEKAIIPLEYNVNEKGEIYEVWIPLLGYARADGTILLRKDATLENEINSTVLNQLSYNDNVDTMMLVKQSNLVKNILSVLRDQYLLLLNKGQTTKAESSAEFINKLNSMEEIDIIVAYVDKALSLLNPLIQNYNSLLELEKVKGMDVWDLKTLASWKTYAESFENLVAVQNFLFENKGKLPDNLVNKVSSALNTAIGYKNNLEQAYKSKGTAIWIKWLAPYVTVVEAEFRRDAEREFKRKNKGTAAIKDKVAMNAYIENYVNSRRREIENRTKQLLLDQSESIKAGDINMVSRMLDTIFESRDTVVGAMAKAYHTTYMESLDVYNNMYKELVALSNELEKALYKSDLKEMYSFMYDIHDDTPYLVSRIPVSFMKAYDDFIAATNANPEYETAGEKAIAIAEWLNKNAPIADPKALAAKKLAYLDELLSDQIISKDEHDALVKNENASNITKKTWVKMVQKNLITEATADLIREKFNQFNWDARVADKTKYANPKWDALESLRKSNPNDIRVRYYDFIKKLSTIGDQAVPGRFKLNGRLPGMTKELSERVRYDSNLPASILNNIKKELTIVADDTDKGAKMLTDELNRPVNFVPIFFTNPIALEEQSFDIGTLYKEWFRSVNNYRYVNSILPQLEFTKFIVETRKAAVVDHKGNPMKNVLSRVSKKSANEDSNSEDVMMNTENLVRQLNTWFEQVIYQKSNKNLGVIGKVDVAKAVNVLQKYTSLRIMGVNYVSMVNNALMAEMQQAKEAFANKLISTSSYSRASVEYTRDLPNILGDVGARRIESLTNLLDEHFGIFMDYNTGNISDNNKFKKLFRTSTLYFTTQMGEHEAQSRFLIAALIEKRALDEKGNDIGSMFDYFKAVDGKLVFDEDSKVANFGKREQIEFGQKVSAVIRKMHGNYQQYSKVALQQNGFGSLTLMFRKWIYTTWKYRWSKEYYDEFGQEFSKGYYRDGGMFYYNKVRSFFSRFIDEAKALELAEKADWDTLLEDEKANIRRFTTDICMYMLMMALSTLVGSAIDDEDDDDIKNILSNIDYQLFRLQTDITFYINPMSTFRIIQSPLPSTSVVTSTAKLIESFTEPTKKYERGPKKGEYVIKERVSDLIPLVRQIYRYRDIADEKAMLSIR